MKKLMILAGLLLAGPALAADVDPDPPRLERRVSDLEARVAALERKGCNCAAGVPAAMPAALEATHVWIAHRGFWARKEDAGHFAATSAGYAPATQPQAWQFGAGVSFGRPMTCSGGVCR